MAYTLEKISAADQAKILADANCDKRKKRFLLMRGGHFENNPDLSWAIDRERDSYLFSAPSAPMARQYDYYFFYKKVMYAIHLDTSFTQVVYLDEPLDSSSTLFSEIKKELREAFAIHRVFGLESDRPFSAIFKEED